MLRKKEKPTLEYSDPFMEDDNEHLKNLHNKNIDDSGVYLILSSNNQLLYVGKSKDIRNRLHQHLINCPQKTNSKIEKVKEYLEALQKKEEELKIHYYAINTGNSAYNALIEGTILDYIIQNKKNDPFVRNCWNKRKK